MLSSQALKYLVKAVKIADAVGSTPYGWDSKGQRVIFENTTRRKLIFYIHNSIYCCYLAFVWVRWIQIAFFLETFSSPMAHATLYVATSYSCVIAIQWSIFTNYGQHQIWINNFLGLSEACKGKGHGMGKVKKPVTYFDCAKLCRAFMITCCITFTLDVLSCFALPNAPFFITSLVPNVMEMTWFQLLPLVSIHIYIWIHQWATFVFYVTLCLCYLTCVQNVLKELVPSSKTVWDEDDMDERSELIFIQNPNWFVVEYQKLQIVQGYYNKLWCTPNALYEVFLLVGNTLAYYGAVRLDGARAAQQLVVAIFITTFLDKMWENMGQTYEISREVLQSWKKIRSFQWFTKYLKSVKPVRVYVGSFFYVDRGMKLTLLSIILNNTLTLILSTA